MIDLAVIRRLTDRVSLEKFLFGRYAGELQPFLIDVNAALNNLLRTDLKGAGKFVKATRQLRDNLPPEEGYRVDAWEARYAAWSGDNNLALKKYRKVLKLLQAGRNFQAVAGIRRGLIEVYMYLGRYQEALESGRKALRYYRRKDQQINAAQTLTNMGNVYHRMDQHRRALRYYEKAAESFSETGGMPMAVINFNRANIHASLNETSQARTRYQAAASFYCEAGMEIAQSQAEYSIAYLLFLESRYSEALKKFEQVYESFSRLGDVKSAAVTLLDLVEINVQLNQYGSAILLGEQVAVKYHELRMKYEEGKAHYFVAVAKLELGDLSHAARMLSRAQALFKIEKNRLWLGMIEHARTNLYEARGDFPKAIACAEKAAQVFASCRDEGRKTDAEISRLGALFGAERIDKAHRLARRLEKSKLTGHQVYRLHDILGDFYFSHRNHQRALFHYQAAVGAVEKMLSGLYHDEIRFFFASDKCRTYSRMVECLLELGRVKQSSLVNLSALALINGRVVPRAKLKAEIPPRMLQQMDSLRSSLSKLNRAPSQGTRLLSPVTGYHSAEQRLWQLERKVRTSLYPDQLPDRTVGSPRAESGLDFEVPDNCTLVCFHVGDSRMGAFVTDSTRTQFVDFHVSQDELEGLIRKLNFVFEKSIAFPRSADDSGELARHYLSQLHQTIIAPLLPYVTTEQLCILPDKIFAQIPFGALVDQTGSFLKDRFDVRLLVNPNDLGQKKTASPSFAAADNAVFAVPSDTLRSVTVEGRAIKRTFADAKLYVGPEASCAELGRALVSTTGFLHIAAHASRSSENPLFSRILMGDGPFFPFDLFGTGIGAQLVTLSGCQTAAPGLYYGNSFSLAKAFYRAGAGFVLASLWPVMDKVTMQFMKDFYSLLKNNGDVVGAYQEAQNLLQKRTNNPALWGAFVLLGV